MTPLRSLISAFVGCTFLFICETAFPAEADPFEKTIRPYLSKHCLRCHNDDDARGDLNLNRYTSAKDVSAHFRRWNNITEFIRKGEMPPEEEPQPGIDASNAVVSAVNQILAEEARKNAGDPGVVLPRRLTNTEYDLAVHHLTGVDIRPTKDFPADPAGGEGFNNTGEALSMSPSLVRKYLGAAQHVADHLVLRTDGIRFAPFPVTSYNERKKLTEQAIIDFYGQHDIDVLDYLDAAWRYRFLSETDKPTLDAWARQKELSGRYLALVVETLQVAEPRSGFLKELQELWWSVPRPAGGDAQPPELLRVRDYIDFGRQVLGYPEENLIRSNAGNWPISHLKFRSDTAANRDQPNLNTQRQETLIKAIRVTTPRESPATVRVFLKVTAAFGGPDGFVLVKAPVFTRAERLPRNEDEAKKNETKTLRSVLEEHQPETADRLAFGTHPAGKEIDADSFVLRTPATIEIPISVQMQRQLDGQHMLLPVQVVAESDGANSILVRHSTDTPPKSAYDRNTTLLVAKDSPALQKLVPDAKVFCNTFPNRFCYVNDKRGLAAGFHLVEGYFRDDQPLVSKVLSHQEREELDQLWQELHLATQSAETLLRGFVWFERSERHVLHDKRFDFLRPEDPDLVRYVAATDEQPVLFPLLDRFEREYLDKQGVRRVGDTLQAESPDDNYKMIHGFFEDIRRGLQQYDAVLQDAEKHGISQVLKFAEKAFRRPLTDSEAESLLQLYRQMRNDEQTAEAALRGVVTAILMSPEFCFRYRQTPAGNKVHSLADSELAARLSFFLWSSIPDEELLSTAKQNQLHHEEILKTQVRRMLQDDRIEAFAREFFGQWLRYRDYMAKDPINASAFKGYDDDLRTAIAEEPVRMITHLIQTDAPVTGILNSDVTYLNERLANHYGGDLERKFQQASNDHESEWRQVNGLRQAGRGGLLGTAVVLTTNSAGERTSPVKRGFWTVHHLLGQHFPPPPADVPELPASEKTSTKSIRQLLAAHVENAECAMCHRHFDSLGLAMEGFDPIGRMRTSDAAGRKIDNKAELPNGQTASGLGGLIEYIETNRQQDFVRSLCRRFLGYALGRSVLLSDQPLLDEMEKELAENEYRFSVLFETVVFSKQFRSQRGSDYTTAGR